MLITTAHHRCLTSLAVSDKRIPGWLSIICNLQDWGLVCWEATCLVWSPESCVTLTAAQCSRARVVRWKAKVASSLRDVWQQLFEQQDITVIYTIHFHPWLHDNHTHQCTSACIDRHQLKLTRSNMFIGNQWATSMSWSSIWLERGQQPAELHWSSDWSVV